MCMFSLNFAKIFLINSILVSLKLEVCKQQSSRLIGTSGSIIIPGHEMRMRVEIGHGVLADVDGERPHDVGEAKSSDDRRKGMNRKCFVVYNTTSIER